MRWGASTSRCRGSRASRCTWGKAAGSRGTCWNWSRTREKPDHTSGQSWKPRSRSWRQSRSSGLQHGRTDGRPGHPDGKRPRRRPARAPKATAEAPRRRRSRRATGRPRRAGKDWEKAKDGKGSSNGSGAGWYDWNRRTVRACHHGWRGVWWYPGQMDEEDPLWIDGAPSGSTVPWRGEDDAEGALDLEKRGSPFLRNSDKLYGCADGYPIRAAQKKFQVPVRRSAPCWKPRICFIGDPAASWQVILAGGGGTPGERVSGCDDQKANCGLERRRWRHLRWTVQTRTTRVRCPWRFWKEGESQVHPWCPPQKAVVCWCGGGDAGPRSHRQVWSCIGTWGEKDAVGSCLAGNVAAAVLPQRAPDLRRGGSKDVDQESPRELGKLCESFPKLRNEELSGAQRRVASCRVARGHSRGGGSHGDASKGGVSRRSSDRIWMGGNWRKVCSRSTGILDLAASDGNQRPLSGRRGWTHSQPADDASRRADERTAGDDQPNQRDDDSVAWEGSRTCRNQALGGGEPGARGGLYRTRSEEGISSHCEGYRPHYSQCGWGCAHRASWSGCPGASKRRPWAGPAPHPWSWTGEPSNHCQGTCWDRWWVERCSRPPGAGGDARKRGSAGNLDIQGWEGAERRVRCAQGLATGWNRGLLLHTATYCQPHTLEWLPTESTMAAQPENGL